MATAARQHDLNGDGAKLAVSSSECSGNAFHRTYEYLIFTEALIPFNPAVVKATWTSKGVARITTPPHVDGSPPTRLELGIWLGGRCNIDPAATVQWNFLGGGAIGGARPSPFFYPRWRVFNNIVQATKWILTVGIPQGRAAIEKTQMGIQTGKMAIEWLSDARPLDPSNPYGSWMYAYVMRNEGTTTESYAENLFGSSGTIGPGQVVPTTFVGPPPCGIGPGQLSFNSGETVMPIVGVVPTGCPAYSTGSMNDPVEDEIVDPRYADSAWVGEGDDIDLGDADGDAGTSSVRLFGWPVDLNGDGTTTGPGETEVLSAFVEVDGCLPSTDGTDGDVCVAGTQAPVTPEVDVGYGMSQATYHVLFNNVDKQNGWFNDVGTGCTAVGSGGWIYDHQSHWADGYYKFLAAELRFDAVNNRWDWRPQVGEYDPSPGGGFRVTDLKDESAMAGRWRFAVSNGGTGTRLRIDVTGLVQHTDAACTGGVFVEDFASSLNGAFSAPLSDRDHVTNVFGLTTTTVTAPLETHVRTSGLIEGVQPTGGFMSYADEVPNGTMQDALVSGVDTLGRSHTCWTPTFGGILPWNPLLAANQPCHIDDDAFGWPALAEFHRSGYDALMAF